MTSHYAIGLDFGTLSVRALVVDVDSGKEIASASYEYPCGVMTKTLPCGRVLPEGYALADPKDYIAGMTRVVREAIVQSDVDASDIIGMGLDCTSSTVLPVNETGIPLSQIEAWAEHPQAWMKLWKHHGAQEQARRMTHTAQQLDVAWLDSYGGGVQCELMLPKVLETAEKDPAVWQACTYYLELGDWLVWQLTGHLTRSLPMAGCNNYYHDGYPDEAFWHAVSPKCEGIAAKLRGKFVPLGKKAGTLTVEMAEMLGLAAGIPIASALIDSHASVMGCGADHAGDMVAVLGTSACYLMNSEQGRGIPGIYSVAYEAHSPKLYGYEGGQSSMGDGLDWFVKTCVPQTVREAAAQESMNLHTYLSREAQKLPPGGRGVMALDWFNGVRSPLMRPDLTGVLTGITLQTTTAEIYRAVVEASCCGARRVIDCYREAGIPVKRMFAAGGIPGKNPFQMQVLADVCGLDICVCASKQASALGAAIHGASCGGAYGSLAACIKRMSAGVSTTYVPQRHEQYDALYRRYRRLCDLFEHAAL